MRKFTFLLLLAILVSVQVVSAQEQPCTGETYYSLEEALKDPEKVTVLDIAMQDPKLTSLPVEIALLVNLECLDLSFNQISKLPDELKSLQKLKVLNLAGNRYMANFPDVLKELPLLETVDLTEKPEWNKAKCDAAKAALPNVNVLTDK